MSWSMTLCCVIYRDRVWRSSFTACPFLLQNFNCVRLLFSTLYFVLFFYTFNIVCVCVCVCMVCVCSLFQTFYCVSFLLVVVYAWESKHAVEGWRERPREEEVRTQASTKGSYMRMHTHMHTRIHTHTHIHTPQLCLIFSKIKYPSLPPSPGVDKGWGLCLYMLVCGESNYFIFK